MELKLSSIGWPSITIPFTEGKTYREVLDGISNPEADRDYRHMIPENALLWVKRACGGHGLPNQTRHTLSEIWMGPQRYGMVAPSLPSETFPTLDSWLDSPASEDYVVVVPIPG